MRRDNSSDYAFIWFNWFNWLFDRHVFWCEVLLRVFS